MQVTSLAHKLAIGLTAMASGRAMTLAYISRAGDGGAGDPPDAWLMPLLGDALIGLTAVAVAWLLATRRTPLVWVIAIAWGTVAAFDALAAFVVDVTSPWPEFFMLELFGRSMFFIAVAMHITIMYLLSRAEVRKAFRVAAPQPAASAE